MSDFDPSKHLVKIKFRGGEPRDYLPVAARIMWLRALYPQAVIKTWPITDEPGVRSTWGARVTLPDGGAATGYGSRRHSDNRGDYFESGETRALGRALAHLGIATEYIDPDESDEGVDETGNRAAVDSGRQQYEPRRSIAVPTATSSTRRPPPQVKTQTGDIRPPLPITAAPGSQGDRPSQAAYSRFWQATRDAGWKRDEVLLRFQQEFHHDVEVARPDELERMLAIVEDRVGPPAEQAQS